MTTEDCCVRCRADALDVAELEDGTVCLGCLTVDEQELLFIAGEATPPPDASDAGESPR